MWFVVTNVWTYDPEGHPMEGYGNISSVRLIGGFASEEKAISYLESRGWEREVWSGDHKRWNHKTRKGLAVLRQPEKS